MHRTSFRFLGSVLMLLLLAGCGMPAPISDGRRRPVALRFGMFVTGDPAHNPINPPERFEGYHVGLDYETYPSEANADVPVYAICSGSVLYSGFAEGYGGLLVQRCKIRDDEVNVIYGHLDGENLPAEEIVLGSGDPIGILAEARSKWSDGNRKHLHLGIHRGETLDLRGYVQTTEELQEFLDPSIVLPRGASGWPVEKFNIAKITP